MSPYLLREEILGLKDKWQGQPAPELYRELSELLFTAGKIPAAMNLVEHSMSVNALSVEDSGASLIREQEERAERRGLMDLYDRNERVDEGEISEAENVGESEEEISAFIDFKHSPAPFYPHSPSVSGSHIEGERWFRRGLEYADACLYEEACSCLSVALEMGFDGFETHYCLAGMHKSLGRLAQAESHCRKSMEYNPAFCPAFILLGAIVKLEGRLVESAEAVQKALFIDPDCAPAHYDLACYRALSGEIDPAFEALEAALRKGFRDFDWMSHDPDLEPLRAFPEFGLLLEIHSPKKSEKPA